MCIHIRAGSGSGESSLLQTVQGLEKRYKIIEHLLLISWEGEWGGGDEATAVLVAVYFSNTPTGF